MTKLNLEEIESIVKTHFDISTDEVEPMISRIRELEAALTELVKVRDLLNNINLETEFPREIKAWQTARELIKKEGGV